jgi:hypothetical protein
MNFNRIKCWLFGHNIYWVSGNFDFLFYRRCKRCDLDENIFQPIRGDVEIEKTFNQCQPTTNRIMVDTEIELGQKVQDQISGFTGIVTTVGEHFNGCERIGVYPSGEEQAASRGEQEFFFEDQLEVLEEENEFTDEVREDVYDIDLELGNIVQHIPTGFEGYIGVINYHLWNTPQIAVYRGEAEDEVNNEWFDLPSLQHISEGLADHCEEVKDNADSATDTGPIEDKGSQNLSR